MRTALALAALLVLGTSARADLTTRSEGADSWGHVAVALTRTGDGIHQLVFALYDSGRILYRDGFDHDVVTLTAEETKALVEGNDGLTECIAVFTHGVRRRDCMWGGIERERPPGWPSAPPAMQKIWKRLAHFTSPRARSWTPDHVTVMASPYTAWMCPTATPPPWPAGWPRPPKTAPGDDRRWSFTLPDAAFERGNHDAWRGCLVADGVKYSLTTRRTMPDDELWLRA